MNIFKHKVFNIPSIGDIRKIRIVDFMKRLIKVPILKSNPSTLSNPPAQPMVVQDKYKYTKLITKYIVIFDRVIGIYEIDGYAYIKLDIVYPEYNYNIYIIDRYSYINFGIVYHEPNYDIYEINNYAYIKVDIVYPESNYEIFCKRKDALFQNFLQKLRKGKPLQDFKKSKNYNYYVKRLKKYRV